MNKYFCNLEKRNFLDKSMPFLEKDNGEVVANQKDILDEVQLFYRKLYSNQNVDDLDLKVELPDAPVLNKEESDFIHSDHS